MGVQQGHPMSPLLSRLCFDRAVHHIYRHVEFMHMVQVGSMMIAAALYPDDIALLAPALFSL